MLSSIPLAACFTKGHEKTTRHGEAPARPSLIFTPNCHQLLSRRALLPARDGRGGGGGRRGQLTFLLVIEKA